MMYADESNLWYLPNQKLFAQKVMKRKQSPAMLKAKKKTKEKKDKKTINDGMKPKVYLTNPKENAFNQYFCGAWGVYKLKKKVTQENEEKRQNPNNEK